MSSVGKKKEELKEMHQACILHYQIDTNPYQAVC